MSFAPRKSTLNSSHSQSNSFRTSHPASPKPLTKSSTKPQPQQRKTPDINDPLLKRIAILEDVVSNLQLQHDTFLPLLQIVDRVGDVLNLEDQATYFINSANDLEVLITRQELTAKEAFENTENIIMPSSVSEGAGSSCRSLPAMQNSLADIEASIHSMLSKRKANLKKQEVQCKEELIKIMQVIDVDLQEVKKEVIELQSALVGSGFKEFDVLDAKDQEIRGRVRTGIKQIEVALGAHDEFGGRGGDNWLLEELSHRVDEAVQELNDYLEYKYRQLEIKFKQEYASLKSQFEKMREQSVHIEAIRSAVKPGVEIVHVVEKGKKAVEALEALAKEEMTMLEDISVNLRENLDELNEKAKGFIKDFSAVEEEDEKLKIAEAGKFEFSQMLKGSLAELSTLQETLQNVKLSSKTELIKLEESISRIEVLKGILDGAGTKTRVEDLKPRKAVLKVTIDEKQCTLEKEAENLELMLLGIWKGLHEEPALGIEFSAKRTDQQEKFEKVEKCF